MNETMQRLSAHFARPIRFSVRPRGLTRAEQRAMLSDLKERLLRPHLARAGSEAVRSRVRWAAEEAASLAWASPFPLLVLPELVEERVARAREEAARQERIRRCTADWLAWAA